MKLFKRTIMLFSVIAVLVSAMTITASAATSVTMKAKIQSFPYLYHGVSYPSAVRALQRFLICMDYSQHDTLTKDGLDGGFGPNVEAAVRYFLTVLDCPTALAKWLLKHGVPLQITCLNKRSLMKPRMVPMSG